ncbi:PEP-CTERM sorting domain-containing protein [Sphingomonas trueperi]
MDTPPSRPTAQPISPVPEPGSWALLLVAFGALGVRLRLRRSSADIERAA